ncbi:predicted protein [Lichtheimia corymbifera JMRC:FSU:9682]|uniref:MIT domain-containing protein n=1 Tax=Lichtheimia corymbifera JMRC:FSU:9682 TaxID=1263082 RepID=A0A068RUP3_9FUNG|nr:predicted protein [Lichtheimia corymbifera JMRC:FSU:9682]
MMPDTPVNAGHAYASRAEDHEEREDWAKAAEAHSQAAEQFQKAVAYTQDAVASKTLQLLALDHLRKAKELERKVIKIQKGRQATKQHSPSGSHSINEHSSSSSSSSSTISSSFDMGSLRQALAGDRKRHHGGRTTHGSSTPAIGGSYAVLPSDGRDEDSDEDADPFNKFWGVVEQLMDNLSNPVAFTSAPLNEYDNPTPAWTQQKSSTTAANMDDEDDHLASKMMESYFFVPDPQQYQNGSESSSSKSNDYATENEQLRKRVNDLTYQVQSLEKAAEERNALKSSIMQFRSDVKKQAKRIMQSQDYSAMRASSSAALMTTSTNTHNGYIRPSGDLVSRIRELEEENRQLKIQNEKQQVLMNKYRERWEKLKESAKKRRAQPEQESPTSSSAYTTCSSDNMKQPTLLRSLAQQSPPYPPFADSTRRTPSLAAGRGSLGN